MVLARGQASVRWILWVGVAQHPLAEILECGSTIAMVFHAMSLECLGSSAADETVGMSGGSGPRLFLV
jgi:hypothetical protein